MKSCSPDLELTMARILTWDLVISNVVTGCQGFRNPWASEAWVKDANSWGLSHPLPASQPARRSLQQVFPDVPRPGQLAPTTGLDNSRTKYNGRLVSADLCLASIGLHQRGGSKLQWLFVFIFTLIIIIS